jgi:hypothetical protein
MSCKHDISYPDTCVLCQNEATRPKPPISAASLREWLESWGSGPNFGRT